MTERSDVDTVPQRERAEKVYRGDAPKILDPDDDLMKKFQSRLHEHLTRLDDRLTEEILELEASIKSAEKELKAQASALYVHQQEAAQQRSTLDQYQTELQKLSVLRREANESLETVKRSHRSVKEKLEATEKRSENLDEEILRLRGLQDRLRDVERDLNANLTVSKRVSSKDAEIRRKLAEEKQRRDFFLLGLTEEVWRIETEVAELDAQLQAKDREKAEAGWMIEEADADLRAVHEEHRSLREAWNTVVGNVRKRDGVYERLQAEREEARRKYDEVLVEIQKLRKETDKEMEKNEDLTSLQTRIESNLRTVTKMVALETSRISNYESELAKLARLTEQAENDYNVANARYQEYARKDEQATKELEAWTAKKNQLEEAIYATLEEKLIHDKAARHMNELLQASKRSTLEQEFLLARAENAYGASLLKLETLSHSLEGRRDELKEIVERGAEKEKSLEELRREIRRCETTTERKQKKLAAVSKTIEQILPSLGGEELTPQDLKIISLEKNVQEVQRSIVSAQQFWTRQQGHAVLLSQQRDAQVAELNLLAKEIMLMEQKNYKLEHALSALAKEEVETNRRLDALEQRARRLNAELVDRKDLQQALEDRNCLTKNECVRSFEELEAELLAMRGNLKKLEEEKVAMREELRTAQQESLAWEKKVQLLQDTIKKIKEERSTGGIAAMKSEIHKMEMRLSHLRRVQEKLINDMELCVARRDIMMDKAAARFKRNTREQHNQSVVVRKRLTDQRTKIKKLKKTAKEMDERAEGLQKETKEMEDKIAECREAFKSLEEETRAKDKEIARLETVKCHNLQRLVLKQRKAKLLRDVKGGRYKLLMKSESTLEEELHTQIVRRQNFREIMQKTDQDFPHLRQSLHKILLALDVD